MEDLGIDPSPLPLPLARRPDRVPARIRKILTGPASSFHPSRFIIGYITLGKVPRMLMRGLNAASSTCHPRTTPKSTLIYSRKSIDLG